MITWNDALPALDNGLVRYEPAKVGDKLGLGSFFCKGVCLGPASDCFLTEENIGQKFYADSVEVLEDGALRAALRFHGYNGKIRLTVDAEIAAGVPAVKFTMYIDPELPVTHRLYVKVPFNTKTMDFVKYPFEETVTADNPRSLRIEPAYRTVPVIFGRQYVNGKPYYLATGYDLRDDFTNGVIAFEKDEDVPFRLYHYDKVVQRSSDMQLTWRNDTLRGVDFDKEVARYCRTFHFDVAVGESQFECLKGHMDMCGYDKTVTMQRSVEECVEECFDALRDCKGYVDGVGYHLLVRSDTSEPDNCTLRGGYGVMIPVSSDAGMAVNFYRYYLAHPRAEWARARAYEMAEFYCKAQLPNGAVTMYSTDTGLVDKAHPENASADFFGGFYILLFDVGYGAYNMLKLYEMLRANGEDHPEWRTAALRAANYLVSLVGEDGVIGRNYNFRGQYDIFCAATADVLTAFEYAYRATGDVKYDEARGKVEAATWSRLIDYNKWMNDSNDSGNWDGSAEPVQNNDGMFIPNFVSYCALMHQRTKEEKYLQMAKDVIMYEWAMSVPVQMPGFVRLTRMLKTEQDFYTNFDPPLMIQEHAIGYQYLAKATNEPVIMELLRIMTQTMLDLEEREDVFKGIHLGLDCDSKTMAPLDRFGEGKQIYVSLSNMVYELANDELCYMYVGGKGWGYGLDYQLPFDLAAIDGKPYVASCTSMVRDQSYNEETATMRYWVYDRKRNEAELEIVWDCAHAPERATVYYNDTSCKASELIEDGVLRLHLVGDGSPSKIVQITFDS